MPFLIATTARAERFKQLFEKPANKGVTLRIGVERVGSGQERKLIQAFLFDSTSFNEEGATTWLLKRGLRPMSFELQAGGPGSGRYPAGSGGNKSSERVYKDGPVKDGTVFFHGTTSSEEFDEFSDEPVYLTGDPSQAEGFANNPLAAGHAEGGDNPRILSITAKGGKTIDITEQVDAALENEEDLDALIATYKNSIDSDAARYVTFSHPSLVEGGDYDFTAVVSLHPQEDLRIEGSGGFKTAKAAKAAYKIQAGGPGSGRYPAGSGGNSSDDEASVGERAKGASSIDDLLEEPMFAKQSRFSSEEKNALNAYRTFEYGSINGALRQGKSNFYSETIDKAFEKAEALGADIVLSRGGAFDDVSMFEAGAEFQDDGFLSTSVNPRVADAFSTSGGRGVIFNITARAGTPYIWMNKSEDEVLLQRGSKMRITTVERVGGVLHVNAVIGD